MADCSKTLLEYGEAISLSRTDRKSLRSARNAITKKVKKYFSENDQCPQVEFVGQGSFSMGTIIKSLNHDYDIDIGVYLRGLSNYRKYWPKPETVSQWLIDALQNHTSENPINKRRCIRIIYSRKVGRKKLAYHVDLPIYVQYINLWPEKKTRIGVIGELQWEGKSDPVLFTKWFNGKCQENPNDTNQLVRLVKYIKAWKDCKSQNSKFPSGIALTTLIATKYSPDNREDKSFYETIRRSYNNVNGLFSMNGIDKPVDPFNDLTSQMSSNQKEFFMKCFEELVDDGKRAINEADVDRSISIWATHFDKRFNN